MSDRRLQTQHQMNGRRRFIKNISTWGLAIPAATIVGRSIGGPVIAGPQRAAQAECEWCGAMDAPANPPPKVVISPPGEPGEPLVISGTIYREDGRTRARDVLLYAYHTNAKGLYPKNTPDNGRDQWRHGYLRGWMRTGADGRYEFRTIKPAAYPSRQEPAHIHLTISAGRYPEYPGTIWFADDPLVTPRVRARNGSMPKMHAMRPAAIITLVRDANGILRGTNDIRLELITD